jgi:hypothetical protein
MVIWSGKGFYVVLIGIFFQVLAMMACKTLLGDFRIYESKGWPKAAAFVLAAGVVWLLAKSMEGRTAYGLDRATGERVAYAPKDTLFFIPMRYWAIIYILLGLYVGIFNPWKH